jgi:serine O-acetyltransferase
MIALAVHRVAHALHQARVPLLPRLLYAVNRIAFALVLPPQARLGPGVILGYQGLGVVIHGEAVLGARVVVAPNVTIGGSGTRRGVPVIGDDVRIGTGARLLGPIHIGHGARIGANAVVLCDVPSGAVAVGVPARVIAAADRHANPPQDRPTDVSDEGLT